MLCRGIRPNWPWIGKEAAHSSAEHHAIDIACYELFEIVIGMPFQFCSVAKLWGCVMPWDEA